MADEWVMKTIACTSAATFTVNDVPTLVKGFYVNTALSAHQADLRDGGNSRLWTTTSMAEGASTDWHGVRFESNCVLVCAAGMSGNLTVFYKDLGRD